MMEPATETRSVISFGPFSLDASRRLLVEDGIELGARTLDILMELVSRPCDVVSKNDLLARVCPDVIVEEGSLRFHIVDLRKAFGYAKDDARDIATLRGARLLFCSGRSGRGDCGFGSFSARQPSTPLIGMFKRERGQRV
jgi:DNA-binding response OmpR family regulator